MSRRLRASALVLACATALLVTPSLVGPGTPSSAPNPDLESVETRVRATPDELLAGTSSLSTTRIVLAGDSLAAGDGAGSYAPENREPGYACHRSTRGILAGVMPAERRGVVACSRATVADFEGTVAHLLPGAQEPANQLVAIRDQRPDTVLLLVGANDIGFAQLLDDCLVREDFDCSTDSALTLRTGGLLEELKPQLVTLYTRLLDVSPAMLIIPAYPDLLNGVGTCGRINGAERAYGRSVISELNSVIATAVEQVQREHREGDRLGFVPETEQALDGHGPCSEDAWINPYGVVSLLDAAGSSARGQEILHPTATGYAALTRVLIPHLEGRVEPVAQPEHQ